MPLGGYCSVCHRWVWLTPYGECQNGHPALRRARRPAAQAAEPSGERRRAEAAADGAPRARFRWWWRHSLWIAWTFTARVPELGRPSSTSACAPGTRRGRCSGFVYLAAADPDDPRDRHAAPAWSSSLLQLVVSRASVRARPVPAPVLQGDHVRRRAAARAAGAAAAAALLAAVERPALPEGHRRARRRGARSRRRRRSTRILEHAGAIGKPAVRDEVGRLCAHRRPDHRRAGGAAAQARRRARLPHLLPRRRAAHRRGLRGPRAARRRRRRRSTRRWPAPRPRCTVVQQAFDRQLANVLEDRALDLDSEIELLETHRAQRDHVHPDRGAVDERRDQTGARARRRRPTSRGAGAGRRQRPAARAPSAPAAGPLTAGRPARVAEIKAAVDVDRRAGRAQPTGCRRRAASPTSPTRCSATCATRTPAPAARRSPTCSRRSASSTSTRSAPAPARRKIPILGRFANTFDRFAARYQKVATSIERIVDALERSRMALLKDMTVLDKMYELNLDYLKQLDVYIAAGEQALEELHTGQDPGARGRGARPAATSWPRSGSPTCSRRRPLRAPPPRPQAHAHDRHPDGAADPPHPGQRPEPRGEDPELDPHHDPAVEEPDRHRHQPVPAAEGGGAAEAGHRHDQRAAGQERRAAPRRARPRWGARWSAASSTSRRCGRSTPTSSRRSKRRSASRRRAAPGAWRPRARSGACRWSSGRS